MREIKFRALGINDCGELGWIPCWEYGHLTYEQFTAWDTTHHCECDNEKYLIYSEQKTSPKSNVIIKYGYKIIPNDHQTSVWVQHKTVGQYTGLKDKNGKEIYEGDIVIDLHSTEKEKFVIKERMGHIIIQDLKRAGRYFLFYGNDNDCLFEVIDNIYENPELLK